MQHGTNVGYVIHKCRCDDCRRANREYEAARVRRQAQGTSLFVPAEPVRERVRALRRHGMSDDEIARAAGLNDARLSDLMTGHWRTGKPLTRMKRGNAEAIFAVRGRKPNPRTYVTAPDFCDMALDIMALGYSAHWITDRLGLSYQGRSRLLTDRHTAATYTKLARLHGATTQKAPESPEAARSRNFAASQRKTRDSLVSINTERLKAALADRPAKQVEDDAGLASGQVGRLMERGGASTLSKVASALGVSERELVA